MLDIKGLTVEVEMGKRQAIWRKRQTWLVFWTVNYYLKALSKLHTLPV